MCFSFYITCVYILLLYSSYIFFSLPPAKKAKFPCGVCKKACNAKSVGCGECDYMVSLFLWETWPLLNDYVNIFHLNSQKPFEGAHPRIVHGLDVAWGLFHYIQFYCK